MEKVKLKGAYTDVVADIKAVKWQGVNIYPDYPKGYEYHTGKGVRFIVAPVVREVLQEAVFNNEGEEVSPAVLGEYYTNLVLPEGYDLSTFNTLSDD